MSQETDPKTQKIVEGYQALAQRTKAMRQRVFELEMQVRDFNRVTKALNDVEPERPAYRLVGDTLVRMNVREAAEVVVKNQQGLTAVLSQAMAGLRAAEKEFTDYQVKNKIRVMDE